MWQEDSGGYEINTCINNQLRKSRRDEAERTQRGALRHLWLTARQDRLPVQKGWAQHSVSPALVCPERKHALLLWGAWEPRAHRCHRPWRMHRGAVRVSRGVRLCRQVWLCQSPGVQDGFCQPSRHGVVGESVVEGQLWVHEAGGEGAGEAVGGDPGGSRRRLRRGWRPAGQVQALQETPSFTVQIRSILFFIFIIYILLILIIRGPSHGSQLFCPEELPGWGAAHVWLSQGERSCVE